MSLKFGIFVPQGWKMDLNEIADPIEQFEAMTAVAKAADAGPWDSIWVYDHFHTVPEPTHETTFESWTISATLARDTQRVNVGQMVNCNGYRNPALFAKIASTVDVASHGRLYAGYGAGWYEHEWKAYGYGYPETKERMARFKEGVQIIHKMWTEDAPTFSGKYYSIDEPINEPKSARPGRKVPLWIGGGGEKVTLRLVAQYADACNVGRGDPEIIRNKIEILKQHCENEGRNYDEITKSTEFYFYPITEGEDPVAKSATLRKHMNDQSYEHFANDITVATKEQILDRIGKSVEAGIDYAIIYLPGVAYNHDILHWFEEEIIASFS